MDTDVQRQAEALRALTALSEELAEKHNLSPAQMIAVSRWLEVYWIDQYNKDANKT